VHGVLLLLLLLLLLLPSDLTHRRTQHPDANAAHTALLRARLPIHWPGMLRAGMVLSESKKRL